MGHKRKGDDENMGVADNKADIIWIQLVLNPLNGLELGKAGIWNIAVATQFQNIFVAFVRERSGDISAGGPPPAKAERMVHEYHRSLAKHIG